MRKLWSLIAVAFIQLSMMPFLFAQEDVTGYEKYFINKQGNQEEYQQYKGEQIGFYEPSTPVQKLFNLDGIEFGVPYTIKKIQMYYSLAVPQVDFLISKVGDKSGKDFHIKCRNIESTDKKPGIEDMPAYLYKPVKELQDLYIGRTVSSYGKFFTVSSIGIGQNVVTFVYTADDGDTFEEPVLEALDYTVDDSLISVEKPENEAIQYGKTEVITEDRITKYSYVDNFVNIIIFHDGKRFVFSVKNNSDNSIKIVWDEAAYVDAGGSTSKVIHNGIKYSERENSQIPSIIVKGAMLNDVAAPVNNIRYDEFASWYSLPMYKPVEEGNVALLLPIQIKGVTNEYLFVFQRKIVRRHPELHGLL